MYSPDRHQLSKANLIVHLIVPQFDLAVDVTYAYFPPKMPKIRAYFNYTSVVFHHKFQTSFGSMRLQVRKLQMIAVDDPTHQSQAAWARSQGGYVSLVVLSMRLPLGQAPGMDGSFNFRSCETITNHGWRTTGCFWLDGREVRMEEGLNGRGLSRHD